MPGYHGDKCYIHIVFRLSIWLYIVDSIRAYHKYSPTSQQHQKIKKKFPEISRNGGQLRLLSDSLVTMHLWVLLCINKNSHRKTTVDLAPMGSHHCQENSSNDCKHVRKLSRGPHLCFVIPFHTLQEFWQKMWDLLSTGIPQ